MLESSLNDLQYYSKLLLHNRCLWRFLKEVYFHINRETGTHTQDGFLGSECRHQIRSGHTYFSSDSVRFVIFIFCTCQWLHCQHKPRLFKLVARCWRCFFWYHSRFCGLQMQCKRFKAHIFVASCHQFVTKDITGTKDQLLSLQKYFSSEDAALSRH